MAVHYFTCGYCGRTITDSNTKVVHKCLSCGGDMRWNLNIAIHGNYRHPVHSDAMAISPTQVAEHKQLFPDIEIDSECRPVFDNFSKHEAYMKKCGIVKTPQKIKRSGAKRIA